MYLKIDNCWHLISAKLCHEFVLLGTHINVSKTNMILIRPKGLRKVIYVILIIGPNKFRKYSDYALSSFIYYH